VNEVDAAWNQLLKRPRPKAKGSLSAAQARAWRLLCISDLNLTRVMADGDAEQISRAIHSCVAAHGHFTRMMKLVKDCEIEDRIAEIERQLDMGSGVGTQNKRGG
jgi:hypothetical protein